MEANPQNVTYLPNVIRPGDRVEIDALCAAAHLLISRRLGDTSADYTDVEAFAWELSEIAHKLIGIARRNTPMPDWWRA
jgi:hypothetical protein